MSMSLGELGAQILFEESQLFPSNEICGLKSLIYCYKSDFKPLRVCVQQHLLYCKHYLNVNK